MASGRKKTSKRTVALARRPIVQAPLAQLPSEAGERRALGSCRALEALFPAPPPRVELPSGYSKVLSELKRRIEQTRLTAVIAANTAMIHARQEHEGWGSKGDRQALLRPAPSVPRHERPVSSKPEVHARVRFG